MEENSNTNSEISLQNPGGLVYSNLAAKQHTQNKDETGDLEIIKLEGVEGGVSVTVSPDMEEGKIYPATEETTPSSQADRSLITRAKGILLILMAIFSEAGLSGITKYLKDFPTGELLIITGIYSMLFLSIVVAFYGVPLIKFPSKRLVFVRVMFSMVVQVARIWSFQNLHLGDATALLFTSPLFACILGRIFLKEKLALPHIIAMVLGIAGIVMIAKPSFIFSEKESGPWYYNLAPLSGAICMGSAYIAQRKIGTEVSFITISMYISLVGTIGGLGFQTISGDDYVSPRCDAQRFLIPVTGLFAMLGMIGLNKGLHYEKAATASLMRNFDTVLAFLIQVIVFSDPIETLSLAGTALIMIGTLTLTLSKVFDVSCGVMI